jgi:hypothetical protein
MPSALPRRDRSEVYLDQLVFSRRDPTRRRLGAAWPFRHAAPGWRCARISLLFTMSQKAGSPKGTAIGFFKRDVSCRRSPPAPGWWSQTGSNRRPPACKAGALPVELWPHHRLPGVPRTACLKLVGPGRLELPTSRLSGVRSNHLSYGPNPRASGDPELG